jgi:hypothetical protein
MVFGFEKETNVRLVDGREMEGDDYALPKFNAFEFVLTVFAENYKENPIKIRIPCKDFETYSKTLSKRFLPAPE